MGAPAEPTLSQYAEINCIPSTLPKARQRRYTRDHLSCFDLIDTPIWVFDPQRKSMWWANEAACYLWSADSCKDLVQRDFASDMSKASENMMNKWLGQFHRGEESTKQTWTFHPNGGKDGPKTCELLISGIYITSPETDETRLCMLNVVEKVIDGKSRTTEDDVKTIRRTEMMRHFPICARQFDRQGNLMDQNPQALSIFGSPASSTKTNDTDDATATSDTNSTTASAASKSLVGDTIATSDATKTTDQAEASESEDRTVGGEHGSIDMSTRSTTASVTTDGGANLNDFLAQFVDLDEGKQVLEEVWEGHDYGTEIQQRTVNGPKWFTLNLRQIQDPVTSEPVIIYSARDITSVMKSAKEETDRQNMKKNEFFAVMAHEIRTPLHQIVGFIELLGEPGALQKNDALDHVGMLESSALALMAIINDLLDFTKLEAGKMKLETIPFEVRGVLEGCVAAVGHQAVEEKGLQVTCDIEQAIPVKLMGDPNRLRQVILNMLTNAVKFTQTYNALNGNPGDIQIRASRKTDDTSRRVVVHFSVKDTGIGMSKHHCARIFNAYQQADASVARNYGGTGLGLAICKSLVEIMGGQIGVESKLGFGTTFWFEIPLQKHVISNRYSRSTPFLANAAAESEGEDDIVSGLRILVAEDNKVNQKVISKMLTRIGHVPVIVPDGQAAVDEIMKTVLALSALSLEESSPEQQKPAYDLVLMDWQMPIMDGIDATKEIRNRGYSMADLPIVGLTASIQNLDWSSVGMNDCLMKPVRIADLKESIHKNFTSASLRREIESRKNMPSDDILEKPPTPT